MSRALPTVILSLAVLALGACDGDQPDAEVVDTGGETASPVAVGVDLDAFEPGAIVGDATIVSCTLSGGVESTCYLFTLAGVPVEHEIGPFCPRNIADDASTGGIWLEGGEVYELSGAWIADLANFYDDDQWQLYDEVTGDIFVTDSKEACEGAARPDVDPAYQNHCVECDLSYLDIEPVAVVAIPVVPVRRAAAQELGRMGRVGVSLGGVVYDPPAPVDAILGAHTIAAFDDCGGHINPAEGYHYHAATGCAVERASSDGHAPLIGYALDGYGLFAMEDDAGEPADLDVCRGHEDAVRGYHYHVAGAGENMFIGCFAGEVGSITQ